MMEVFLWIEFQFLQDVISDGWCVNPHFIIPLEIRLDLSVASDASSQFVHKWWRRAVTWKRSLN
jgi:hypothetical protein